ncbi:hypothetical protein CBR_g20097 [Chara braunii]|uniref:Uncharacterized protein n=1 Tax=Chara braunii TaxID=69332 RepID=A0A388KZI1_CHABU|nr:hypothetical protein CBR_g20097 [Chara braunii]|eukprot:GBG75465.1 hypothetical protein CBR_g20097 [Chara braunii]
METEAILSGLSPASGVIQTTFHQQTSGGGTASAACEEVLATIHMETEHMLAGVDDNDSGARGNSAEIKKVGGERNEEDVGSEGPHSGCIVTDANVTKTMAGDTYPVLRLNDGATTHDACHYALEMYRVLEAKGELLLNDFLYDNFDCGQLRVLGGQQRREGTPVGQDDARRDPRWGWVPSEIPFGYGRVKMQVRDIMGNVWSAHYVNGMFSFRHFDREATADEKVAVTCRPRDARIFDPPLGSPVELALVEGTVFSEGMPDEGDVDMTKQQKGGTYMPADFKQTLMAQAKKWGMVVEDSKNEMKSGAAEILVLSRLKDIPQAPPQDFQDLPVIIANGVEYVLLDQLVDFMKKKPDDRNVIHEALHDVTEQALAGKDLINYRVRRVDEDVACGTPLWDGIFMAALHHLSIATSEVDGNRSREEGWKLVFREADVALHAADGHTSAGEEIVRTVSIMSESYKMNEGVDDKGCIMGSKAKYSSETARNDEQSCGPSVTEPLLPLSSERSVKRWKRIMEDLWYAEIYEIMTTDDVQYSQMVHEPLFSIVRGNRSRAMIAEAGKRPERVDEEHLFPFTWKSIRYAIAITKRDVLRLGAKQWLNDDVIDMYLQSVYEEHFPAEDNTTLHVCTTFWHPAVIANQKVYVVKGEWQERIKSRPAKLR